MISLAARIAACNFRVQSMKSLNGQLGSVGFVHSLKTEPEHLTKGFSSAKDKES